MKKLVASFIHSKKYLIDSSCFSSRKTFSSLESEIPVHYPFKYWQENHQHVKKNVEYRKVNANVDLVLDLYKEHLHLIRKVNALRAQRHVFAKEFLDRKNDPQLYDDKEPSIIKDFKKELQDLESSLFENQTLLYREAAFIPNESHSSSPIGDETNNQIIFESTPNIQYEASLFKAKDHMEIAKALDIIDFPAAAKSTGSNFYYLKREGVLLEFALIQYALQKAITKGFIPIMTPELIKTHFIEKCGFQPRSIGEHRCPPIYTVQKMDHESSSISTLSLIGTSELTLAAMHANERLKKEELPIKYVGFSHCFRPEAGHAGKESKGLYRVHQFSKVELFIICEASESGTAFETIIELEKDIFMDLGFHIRVLNMATEELGASAYKKYDIEAWMPGKSAWGEISSASNCTDYQSRRLNIRYKDDRLKLAFPYTLNGTAISIPRAILTLLENGQQKDGSVKLPAVLKPWMADKDILYPIK